MSFDVLWFGGGLIKVGIMCYIKDNVCMVCVLYDKL